MQQRVQQISMPSIFLYCPAEANRWWCLVVVVGQSNANPLLLLMLGKEYALAV